MAATWAWVTAPVSDRSPSAGVSGPRTASQIASEPSTFSPWLRQPCGASPRPWSVVTISVVVPRYCGCAWSSSQSVLRAASASWAARRYWS